MVTHLEPQSRKNGRSRKHCKTHDSCGVGGEGRSALSPPERRDAYGKDTARPLAGYMLAAPAADPFVRPRGYPRSTAGRPQVESGRQIYM